jgi:hypothetical protein
MFRPPGGGRGKGPFGGGSMPPGSGGTPPEIPRSGGGGFSSGCEDMFLQFSNMFLEDAGIFHSIYELGEIIAQLST